MSRPIRLMGAAFAIALLLLVTATAASATNNADRFFTDLFQQRITPAPLVPTTVPRSLSPVGESVATFDEPHGYLIRMQQPSRGRPRALVDLVAGQYPSARAAARDYRTFRSRGTVVRGKHGYLLTKRSGRGLVWSEGGVVYVLLTSTPKTVSLSELRKTASGLERLQGVWAANDPRGDFDVIVASTPHTFTAVVMFAAPCFNPATGEPTGLRHGTARVSFVPRQGDALFFDIGPNLEPDVSEQGRPGLPWQGTVSGTVGTRGGRINLQATAADADSTCDTGPVSMTLHRFP